jgi:O-antigen/teichoic acid export membrane protein
MVVLLAILIPFLCFVLWLYYKFTPKHTDKKSLRIYNLIVMLLAFLSCLFVSLHFYNTTGQSVDSAWWPILALMGSLLLFPSIVFIGGIIRNFFMFKQNKSVT